MYAGRQLVNHGLANNVQVNDPANPAKKIDDYWTPSQGLLGDPSFMQRLQARPANLGWVGLGWAGLRRNFTSCLQRQHAAARVCISRQGWGLEG